MREHDLNKLVLVCIEANAFYIAMSEKHRKINPSVLGCTSIERANSVMGEAFLMRAEVLTQI